MASYPITPRFVHKCCPGLSMEEWNVFLSLLELDKEEEVLEEEGEEENEENDDDVESNLYGRPTKGRKKEIKQKERTRKNKQK